MTDPAHIPVILGVGQLADRPADPMAGLDALQLMVEAIRLADADGGGGLTPRCDWLAIVPQLSFPDIDPVAQLPAALGIAPAHVEQNHMASGDTPVRYLNDAANAIARGEASVAIIVGGEGLRTAATRPAATDKKPGGAMGSAAFRNASEHRRKYGLVNPAEIYPLYENAARAAWGQTLEQGQAETGRIWSLMADAAQHSDAAWIQKPMAAQEVAQPSASNRMIAFPFTKMMVANAGVNQGAAVIVTSLAIAQALGRGGQAIFVGAGAAAHEPDDALDRARWDRSASMEVALTKAVEANGLTHDDLDHVELYSCFPNVPKMARRILHWPETRPATVHGGLTFGGGPVGNYMTHAIVQMVRALRHSGSHGLLFGNGGYCTHNHAILLSVTPPPPGSLPQEYHVQAEADALPGPTVPLRDDIEGAATLETYTVVYGREGPSYGVVMARTEGGERLVARVDADDSETIDFLTSGVAEPVGAAGITERRGDMLHWRRA